MTAQKRYRGGRALILGLILVFPLLAAARGNEDRSGYDVRRIPPGLRQKASAMIRLDSAQLQVFNRSEARYERTYAVTIFRKEGRDLGTIDLSYDRFSEIRDLDGWLYDRDGQEIRSLESADVRDESDISASSLYEEARHRSGELYHDQYPYTVVFHYIISYDGYLSWPGWAAQPSDEAVEHSRFEVVVPEEENLRYWTSRERAQPRVTELDGRRHYVWEASNLPELTAADLEEDLDRRTLVVRTAPRIFEIGGFPGVMSTWQQFGLWYYELARDRTLLPEQARNAVHALVAGAGSVREKVARLYSYMQDRTRYVSIQLGIGGWQPFDAQYVEERGYGDCKALSNYMIALLREAGITAYAALVRAGHAVPPIRRDFPSQQFNHEIVCVPDGRDSIWLECTSETYPVGHNGSFTENRDVLLATPEGGVLVRTPLPRSQDNRQHRAGRIVLMTSGSAAASITTLWTGDQEDHPRAVLHDASPEDVRKWILNTLQVSNLRVKSYELPDMKVRGTQLTLSLELEIPQLAAISDTRLFLRPNVFEQRTSIPREFARRLSPVRLPCAYLVTDSVVFVLPSGFLVEALPPAADLKASFGSFHEGVEQGANNDLLYTRRLEFISGEIPPGDYAEYRRFMSEVVRADRMQVVLRRQGK